MSKYCISCGAELTVGTKFCVNCGTKIEAKKPVEKLKTSTPSQEFCTNCGTKLPGGTKFCVECGAKFEAKKSIEKPTEPIKETIEKTKPQPPEEPKIAAIPSPPPPTMSKPMPPSYVPHPKPKSKLRVIGAVAVVAILLVSVFYVGFMMGGKEGEVGGGGANKVDITTGDNIPVVTSQSVEYSGGTISVTDSSNPLYGLKIEVPEAAISISNEVDFSISYTDITNSSGLPEEASIASWMINIETDGTDVWNEYKAFDKPCIVTLPYNPNIVTNEESVRFYYYDEENNILGSTGFISQDTSSNTVTFYAGTFSNFTAIEISLALHEFFDQGYSVDTGFRPATDGWVIENYGSYLESDGNCLGMVNYARWYYTHKKPTTNEALHSKYIEGDPDEWRDDETAIQLATRCQMGPQGIWNSLSPAETQWGFTKSHDVAYSIIHGMIVSNEPQLIIIALVFQNGTWAKGCHAIMAYQYTGGRFDIYDPNYAGTAPGTDTRQIPFTYNDGFTRSYSSGQNAGEGRQYNVFFHLGAKIFSPANAYSGLYDSAEKKFEDDSIFPTVILTDLNSGGSTPIDTDEDGIRDTTESKATISGTITGGQQEISSTLIFVSNQKFETAVDATTHEFSKEVPLFTGENEIIILATDENTWSDWAGFLKDSIKSSASEASLTFTMTWGQGQSDVDLHVLEPTINTTEGRHIYYGNMGSQYDNYPYLDVDNTQGYGPEHYYATGEMKLTNSESLYGTYKFRVHYFADHDGDDENTQPITWHLSVKYLAFKDELTGEEYWEENAWSGSLAVESTYSTGNFDNTGASWDTIYTVTYPQPNPEDYGIPPPPQNELPE